MDLSRKTSSMGTAWTRPVGWVGLMMLAILTLVTVDDTWAEGGVVFGDIASDLDYRRAPAANFPELVDLLERTRT